MNNEHLKHLYRAVLKLLRPLVRILLRNGVSFQSFSDLAKWVYIDVADKEFGIKNRKQSISRISVVTGLSRKEILRVRKLAQPYDISSDQKYNRAARVIAGWRREKDFHDTKGKPAPLPITGPGISFSELVKRFSGDVPVRATLDELVRVGAVKQLDDGRISLIARSYIPESDEAVKLHILGKDVEHLISTIDHNLKVNLKLDPIGPFFQREAAYDNLPDEILPEFRKQSSKKAQSLLEKIDKWLAQHDRDVTPSVKGKGRNHAGIGIYYFERPYSDEDI